ncbi:MAG TPA: serine/threonine-protein kinase [Candidatus Eisenbacteria bacterium]|nr:serine/threonine-protein kinase [Candidatus Eisenbacteria bacterium]
MSDENAPKSDGGIEEAPTARTLKGLEAGEASAILSPAEPAAPPLTPPEAAAIAADPTRQVNQYLLVAQVGAGGMGAVWKAWDTAGRRWVAVKFLNAIDDDSIRRFRREAQVTQRLHHPNICTIHDVAEGKGRPYLVMDFLEGGPIGSAGAPLRALVETFVKVCRAIEYAHKNGVIHRDIKPANIMVSPSGEPCVTDFGLAKVVMPQSTISIAAAVMGTPSFMPPEQASGRIQAQDEKSDLYSLGATLYTVTTGKPPFERENATATLFEVCSTDPVAPRKINAMIPRPLEAVILKAMDKDKRLRYGSAEEMALDLERWLKGEPVLARPPGSVRKLARKVRANPFAAGGIALFVLAVAVMVFVLARPRPPSETVIVNNPAPPSAGATDDQKWRERFEPFQAELMFHNFRSFPEERLVNAKLLLARMPATLDSEVGSWFLGQGTQVPFDVWPRREWWDRKEEARRRVDWCRTIVALLEGKSGKFNEAKNVASDRAARYLPVADYRGSVTLTITATPFAEVKSLRRGDVWIVRDGKKTSDLRSGDVQYTPLVLDDLDIADYAAVLVHPQRGEKSLTISGAAMKHGGRYVFSGSLERPESFTLREVR